MREFDLNIEKVLENWHVAHAIREIIAKCPAGRPGTTDEVANIAELLMSDRGAFITGSTFLADGVATASY